MRFKNSYAAAVAAAVAAVVFSAAFQPAEASVIFYAEMTSGTQMTFYTQGSINTTSLSSAVTPTTGNSPLQYPALGSTTLSTGTSIDNTITTPASSWTMPLGSNPSTVSTAVLFPAFAASSNSSIIRFSILGSGSMQLRLPQSYVSGSPLAGNQTYGDENNGFVTSLSADFGWSDAGTWAAPVVNKTWNLPNGETIQIMSVPEPTQMVSVAGIGAAYGAWRLRKLRRSRTAAGEAIAG